LHDESLAVVRTATLAIGAIGGCQTLDILVALLAHDALWVRKAAVQAIGIAQCQDAVPILVNLMGDESLDVLVRESLVALKVDPDFF
jgi:HEAT repeat protein